MDYTAVGQTTHLAARMEQMATPGTILLAPATLAARRRLRRGAALGPVAVKGSAEPVEVYAVTGASAAADAPPGGRRAGADALRRPRRRDRADSPRRSARADGHGQLVAIVGEPGVGKSRLVYEFTHSHRTQGWPILGSRLGVLRQGHQLPAGHRSAQSLLQGCTTARPTARSGRR